MMKMHHGAVALPPAPPAQKRPIDKEIDEFMLAWGRQRDDSVGGTIAEKNAAWWAWRAARGLLPEVAELMRRHGEAPPLTDPTCLHQRATLAQAKELGFVKAEGEGFVPDQNRCVKCLCDLPNMPTPSTYP